MAKKTKISIIIRTKNEEKWIGGCLDMVFKQDFKDFEVIVVDNNSTDHTVEKAKQYPVKIINIDKFIPGKAINDGIKESTGEFLVCLSAHCIPIQNDWLDNLLANFSDKDVAGVYGRQEPMSFSSALDKRDLLLVFGLDKKIQKKDSFFHNANSMFRRSVWEKTPFDEAATNIEDRIWGREIIKQKLTIIYEPEAGVYHYHGIHQDQNEQRCENIVKIIENLEREDGQGFQPLNLSQMKTMVVIPVRGKPLSLHGTSLLEITIRQAQALKQIDRIVVSTDNEETAELAKKLGADVPFLRDESLSLPHVDLSHVYKYTVSEIEKSGYYADLIIPLEVTFPFRSKAFLEELIQKYATEGLDSVLGVRKEFSSCWKESDEGLQRIDEGFIPREFKEPLFMGVVGIGCVTHPLFLREGRLLGDKVGLIELEDPRCSLEVRDESGLALASSIKLGEDFFLPA
ncbi:MAG: glycosyltransferase family 2 protein [Halobacteriovoraceae bacterium]|jgi:rhamnosyltransferase|nr:glycosyltransferase family 2 protein [Halobacteriovoraceae bacterium]